jgi:hypothetical protein
MPDDTCVLGVANDACGAGGVACDNCRGGSFCNGLVVPRRCNDQQDTCPADYPACPPGTSTPITAEQQGTCSEGELDKLAAACAGGPETPDCVAVMAGVTSACSQCLVPFQVPFAHRDGLWACVASFVGVPCRRAMGCVTDCVDTSCSQCLPSSANQCDTLVTGIGNQCGPFSNQATACTRTALQPGQLCSQFSYSDFGKWFRAVGDHYCGDGP